MISIKNTQRSVPLNQKKIKRAVSAMLTALDYADYDIGILFTGTKAMRSFNKNYRNKDRVTDILSFPYHTNLKAGKRITIHEPEDKNLGDLIICPNYILRTSIKEWNQIFDERLIVLLAHGIAHLLGYDHETDKDHAAMLKIETMLVNKGKHFC